MVQFQTRPNETRTAKKNRRKCENFPLQPQITWYNDIVQEVSRDTFCHVIRRGRGFPTASSVFLAALGRVFALFPETDAAYISNRSRDTFGRTSAGLIIEE
jgi:hypothetical protein